MSQGSEKRVRTAHLTVRLTPDERGSIDDAAERAGLTSGSYARAVLLGAPAPRQVRRPRVDRKELARLLGQIGHIGGNLNQLAKAANCNEFVDPQQVREALASIRSIREGILDAMGRS